MSKPAPPADKPATATTPRLTGNQLRGARYLANLGTRELADAAGLSTAAVNHIETGRTRLPHRASVNALRAVLEDHGVQFAPGGWIRRADDRQAGFEDDSAPAIDWLDVTWYRLTPALEADNERQATSDPAEWLAHTGGIRVIAIIPQANEATQPEETPYTETTPGDASTPSEPPASTPYACWLGRSAETEP